MPRRSASRSKGAPVSKGRGVSKKSPVVDEDSAEKLRKARAYIMANRPMFARHGSIVTSWRQYGDHQLGPYYRVAFREDGQQRSLYLGDCAASAEEIRRLLEELQAPLRAQRQAAKLAAQERKAARLARRKARQAEEKKKAAKRAAAKKATAKKPVAKKRPAKRKPAAKKSAGKKAPAKKRKGR